MQLLYIDQEIYCSLSTLSASLRADYVTNNERKDQKTPTEYWLADTDVIYGYILVKTKQ